MKNPPTEHPPLRPGQATEEYREYFLGDCLRVIRRHDFKLVPHIGQVIGFEPSEKWKNEFSQVGFWVTEIRPGQWLISNKNIMDFTKSKETSGGYSLRCLVQNGPLINGEWQDPESCKWNREVWDAKTGVLIKGDKPLPGFYDLQAPE